MVTGSLTTDASISVARYSSGHANASKLAKQIEGVVLNMKRLVGFRFSLTRGAAAVLALAAACTACTPRLRAYTGELQEGQECMLKKPEGLSLVVKSPDTSLSVGEEEAEIALKPGLHSLSVVKGPPDSGGLKCDFDASAGARYEVAFAAVEVVYVNGNPALKGILSIEQAPTGTTLCTFR